MKTGFKLVKIRLNWSEVVRISLIKVRSKRTRKDRNKEKIASTKFVINGPSLTSNDSRVGEDQGRKAN